LSLVCWKPTVVRDLRMLAHVFWVPWEAGVAARRASARASEGPIHRFKTV
jgi:hypothetical protein